MANASGPGAPGMLADSYEMAMLDLDGVVYIGSEAVPGAAGHLRSAREAGLRLAFVTNNASRPPRAVVDLLDSVGVPAETTDVVTSAQAASRMLLERIGEHGRVALLGGPGLADVLDDAGLTVVGVGDDAEAIISGYGLDVPWRDIMRAAVRIREGLWWVACNTDGTIPTAYGVAPGHGVLVDLLRRFSEVEPDVAGKPSPPLLEETMARMGTRRALMVGDRLDTDVAGGAAVGVDTLLVMTGVTDLAELLAAPADLRPTHVGADLGALRHPKDRPEVRDEGWRLADWQARVEGDRIEVTGDGSTHDWWRVAAAAGWSVTDAGRRPDASRLTPPCAHASTGTGAVGR